MNPLDGTDQPFAMSLMNPNPTSGRNKGGAWYRVAFEVDSETFRQFQSARELAGMVIECEAMVAAINATLKEPEQPVKPPASVSTGAAEILTALTNEPVPKAEPNPIAMRLHKAGYFNSPALWDQIEACGFYIQKSHVKFIESCDCLFAESNKRRHRNITTARGFNCEGQVSGHHCQSATLPSRGGKGPGSRKVPDWYRVPLCHVHHNSWAHGSNKSSASREDKSQLIVIAVRIMAEIAEHVMKEQMQITSLNELTEEMLYEWNQILTKESA